MPAVSVRFRKEGRPFGSSRRRDNKNRSNQRYLLADSGYRAEKNLKYLASEDKPQKSIQAWIATGQEKHTDPPPPAPRGRISKNATRVERMQRKLRTKAGKKVHARRRAVVEAVFGQIKQARGIWQFLLRGREKAKAEWSLICLTHNVVKMHRLGHA